MKDLYTNKRITKAYSNEKCTHRRRNIHHGDLNEETEINWDGGSE